MDDEDDDEDGDELDYPGMDVKEEVNISIIFALFSLFAQSNY